MQMLLRLSAVVVLFASCVQSGVIHVDIEPHSTRDGKYLLGSNKPWDRNKWYRNKIATEWLDLMKAMNERLAPTSHTLKIDVAMAYSMDNPYPNGGRITYKGQKKVLLKHVMDIVDDVVLMDYRNRFEKPRTDSISSHAEAALDIINKYTGKTFSVGVETHKIDIPAGVPAKVTFGALPAREEAMETALMQVITDLSPKYPTIPIGLAVHDFTNYKKAAFLRSAAVDNLLLRKKVSQRYCRSVWLWDTHYVLKKTRKKPQQVFDFAKTHGISTIILEAVEWLVNDNLVDKLKDFIKLAWTQNIEVELMMAGHQNAQKAKHTFVLTQLKKAIAVFDELEKDKPTLQPDHCKEIPTQPTGSTGGAGGAGGKKRGKAGGKSGGKAGGNGQQGGTAGGKGVCDDVSVTHQRGKADS